MAKAGDEVVVHHPGRLHEGVADRGTDETEAEPPELPAHRGRLCGLGRMLIEALEAVDPHLTAHELPDEAVERTPHRDRRQRRARVRDGRRDLRAVADDPRIAE